MVKDYTITSLETITAFDLQVGTLLCILDELQNATIANAEEKTDITGKGGRKLSSLKKNKAVTISGTNGLVSAGLAELQTGSSFNNKVTPVKWHDFLTVTGNKATLNFAAVGTTGNEIASVYMKDANGVQTTALTQDAAAANGKFAYDPATKALTFSNIPDGTEIVVYYDRNIQADVLENLSDVYSRKAAVYVDMLCEDKCGKIYRGQIFIPKADFSGEFSLELGGDQTVHSFEAESLAGACGGSGALWTWTIFDDNAADVAA